MVTPFYRVKISVKGENGDADLVTILAHQAFGTMPAHADDQLAKYGNLVYNYTGLTGQQINTFFNDSAYGVQSNDVERTYSPRSRTSPAPPAPARCSARATPGPRTGCS